MSFALVIIYLLLTLVRPAEQFAALREWPVMTVASVLALMGAAFAVLSGRGPTFRAAQIPIMIAFLTWTAISVLASPLRSASAFESVIGFAKSSGTAFLLMVLSIVTVRRLRIVAITLTLAAVLLAGQAALEHRNQSTENPVMGSDPGFEAYGAQAEGSEGRVGVDESARVFIVGLFGDPNDLALTLVAILPFPLALRRPRALLRNLVVVWLPIAIITYGIYTTRSRGGVLALASVLALSVHDRLGAIRAALAAAVAFAALLAAGFLGSRSMSIDVSAAGRIDAWSDGLQMLRSSPVWGVGLDMFTAYHPRAAHNSFVQCFAELGLVGYLLWLALIMLTLDGLRSVVRYTHDDSKELRRWASAVLTALAGFLIGATFLSRSYDVYLFILLGLGSAVTDLASRRGYIAHKRSALQWSWLVGVAAVSSIVLFWLYMRLLR